MRSIVNAISVLLEGFTAIRHSRCMKCAESFCAEGAYRCLYEPFPALKMGISPLGRLTFLLLRRGREFSPIGQVEFRKKRQRKGDIPARVPRFLKNSGENAPSPDIAAQFCCSEWGKLPSDDVREKTKRYGRGERRDKQKGLASI